MKVFLNKQHPQYQVPKIALLLFLLFLAGVGAAPWYLKGNWPPDAPSIESQNSLIHLGKKGLTLPDWQTTQQEVILIGGQKWSVQTIQSQGSAQHKSLQTEDSTSSQADSPKDVVLLLRPQKDAKDQPAVEWIDIQGQQQWKTDSHQIRQLVIQGSNTQTSANVTIHFFRSWRAGSLYSQQFSGSQAFAVLQWYAWPNGGSPTPFRWFLADQVAQWHKHRLPWVAVSILIPTETLTEGLDTYWPLAESVGTAVQEALMANSLRLQSVR